MLSKLIAFIFGKDSGTINRVIQKSLAVFLVQVAGIFILFAANWLIVKNSSERIYGIYSIIINWFILLNAVTQLGMDDYHVAKLPVHRIRHEGNAIRGIFLWSSRLVSLTSMGMMVIVLLTVNFLPIAALQALKNYFNIAVLLILLQAVLGNTIAFLRGLNEVVISQVVDKIVRPLGLLVMLWLLGRPQLTYDTVILSQAVSLVTALALAFALAKKYLGRDQSPSAFDRSLQTNKYFMIITLLQLLATRMDFFVLSLFADPQRTGYYNVAMKFADLAAYPLFIINLVIPAYLAQHNYENDRPRLHAFMRNSSRAAFLGVSGLLLLLLCMGIPVLGLFGDNFRQGFPVLVILACSHLVSTFKAPVNGLLVVGGEEKRATRFLLINVAVTALLCFISIPYWNIYGAAFSILAGNAVHTAMLLRFFYKRENKLITPFSG